MHAAVEEVRSLLASACAGSSPENFPIEGERQVVIANIDRADALPAVGRALAALIGTGWTAFAAEWFDGPSDVILRIADRQNFGTFQWLAPPRRCQPRDWDIQTVLQAADCMTDADVDDQLEALERERSYFWRDQVGVEIRLQLASTEQRYGKAPRVSDIPPDARRTPASLDRWLLDWELRHGPPEVGKEFPEWQLGIGHGVSVVALPWARAEVVLAADLIHGAPAVLAVALLERWHRRYGTRVVSHCGAGVALESERLPTTVDEAHSIARAIDLIANDLLGGATRTKRDARTPTA
ncbi:hypothetical protein [Nitriliruptor alkaliphilus]|uniref:hypothetical protein n=1 Tax=Nitriliruptor alkaliphilus TaxID=427918 RepID=UPI000697093F|nr:hypothetical protein [Nitriliruptor alkaliphilus]